jgi:hypothetical protein
MGRIAVPKDEATLELLVERLKRVLEEAAAVGPGRRQKRSVRNKERKNSIRSRFGSAGQSG